MTGTRDQEERREIDLLFDELYEDPFVQSVASGGPLTEEHLLAMAEEAEEFAVACGKTPNEEAAHERYLGELRRLKKARAGLKSKDPDIAYAAAEEAARISGVVA